MLYSRKKATSKGIYAILVVDSHRKIVSINKYFIDLWNLPKELIVSRDDELVLTYISAYFVEPQKVIQVITDVYAERNSEIHDTIQLIDGRCFSRHSQPLWFEGEYTGRVWQFQDLTELMLLNNACLLRQQKLPKYF
ncbi:MAG: hypothetical protein VKL59_08405 [Nostocaceae cyanobacterium]|nr:hypothetical protein [Nostocaceae cyanobacterium]